MQSFEAILRYGLIGDCPTTGNIAEHRKLIIHQAKQFTVTKATIEADRSLSDEGKRERIRAAAEAALAEIAKGEAVFLAPERRTLATLKGQLASRTAPTRDAVELQREMEIRQILRGMSPGEQQHAIEQAVTLGDPNVIRAVAHSPAGLRLFSDNLVDDAKAAYAKFAAPELFDQVDHVQQVHAVIDQNHADVINGIKQAAGLNDDMRSRLESQQQGQG